MISQELKRWWHTKLYNLNRRIFKRIHQRIDATGHEIQVLKDNLERRRLMRFVKTFTYVKGMVLPMQGIELPPISVIDLLERIERLEALSAKGSEL